ncbi:MAG: DUF11 domain-containing protein [Chitinophagaceae bacterium]|nr:DUF11 domain-containing protein [Chitinophagaceae bacterium]
MKRFKYLFLLCTLTAGYISGYSQTQTLGINQTATGNPGNNCGTCYTITIAYSISNTNATGTQVKATFNNTVFDVCSYGSSSASVSGATTTLTFNEGNKATGAYSVSYSIKFKPGMACTGLNGTLNATIQTIEQPTPVAASPLTLTATSTETWAITKYIQYGGWIWYQGYTVGSPFNYNVANCGAPVDVYYHIRVSNGAGCINLSSSSITDNLPSNATVADVKDGTLTNIPFTTGVGTVTFNIGNGGNTLDVVTGVYDYYIHVTFPPGDIGQTKCNTATLKGTNVCTNVLKSLNSNTECIKLIGSIPGNSCGGFSSPYWFGSGYQYFIGCPASLNIGLGFYNQCNPSSLNWNNIGYSTPIPGQIHVDSFALNAVPAGKWVTITVNTNTCGSFTQTFTGPLSPATINFYAAPFNIPAVCTITNFTLSSNMGINGNNSLSFGQLYFSVLSTAWNTLLPVNVGNTVTMTGATYTTSNGNFSCAPSFVISAKIPKVEVIKDMCNYYNYQFCLNENDTINYSIAVRNYGNANLTGASIKDILPTGLEYIPNSSSFGIYNTYTKCITAGQPGTGITVAHAENSATTNLQWNLPVLAATCNAGSDWYVINFKAKITNLAPAGLLTNSASCFDATNTVMSEVNPWNNSTYVYVCEKKLALELIKEVSKDSLIWDSCVSVTAGAPVYYRLKVHNPGNVAYSQIRLIDLFPNTSISGSDVYVVNCNSRGSSMPVYLTNYIPLGSASFITYSTNPQPNRATAADLNLIPNNTIGCSTPVTWGIPPIGTIQNQKSVRIDFGTFVLGAGQTETFYYKAQTPPGATPGMTGWNSFAASAVQNAVQTLGAESPKVCVNIIDTGCGCIGNFVWFDANNNGLQDSGEPGINGCTITLYNASNVQIGSPVVSTFDINNNPGYYSFCGLTAGSYYLVVTPPAGYSLTIQNNSNPALNSDINPNNNTSAVFAFNCQTNNDLDIGLVIDDGCNCNKSSWGDIYISDNVIINPQLGLAKAAVPVGDAVPFPGAGTTTKLHCKKDQGPITLKCKTTYNFSASYICNKPSCGSVNIVVTLPNGNTTTSTGTASFTTNDGGIYSVAIYGMCGNKICDSCKFVFKVVCPVCPCDPKLTVKPTTQSISHITSPPPYTLLSQNFSITTPPAMLYTQVRAEVVGFTLQSGFNNECISCKNLPYTWSSIYNASNINTNIMVADSITMGVMPPVIQFTPSLTNTHQNPRETIWSDYNGFTMPPTLNMQFILPPKSIITCCTLYAKICVKFTFRDRDCKECEVVVCFNYSIPPSSVHDNPADGSGTETGIPNTVKTGNLMATAIDGECKTCKENEMAPVNEPAVNNNSIGLLPTDANKQEEITIEALEKQLKLLTELKNKGIKRGDVELIPVVENKIKELKSRPAVKGNKK